MQTDGKQFVNFWSWAASKGLMNANTAKTLAAAARQVLLVESGWEEVDVSTMDVDNLLSRFRNARARDFKPASLNAYGRRFRQALDLFLAYNHDPSSWRFLGQESRLNRTRSQGRTPAQGAVMELSRVSTPAASDLIDYPFPLRDDVLVHLRLPIDLKSAEVDRLAAFMRTLVSD